MLDLEQVEAAVAGDIGARYAEFRATALTSDAEIDHALTRVATGCHGTCDACLAGVFARHIAGRRTPADARNVWRTAEWNVVDLLANGRARAAIVELAEALQPAGELSGLAIHNMLSSRFAFGSAPSPSS